MKEGRLDWYLERAKPRLMIDSTGVCDGRSEGCLLALKITGISYVYLLSAGARNMNHEILYHMSIPVKVGF